MPQRYAGKPTTYTYDALGRMASRTKAGTVHNFRYSGLENDIAAITDGAGTTQSTYSRNPFGNLLGLRENGGTAVGVVSDLHDDLVATFSGTALIDSAAYDPFGQVTNRTGTARALGYQGEYTDPDTGKVNMHARWYQPGTGGFASRDDWTLSPIPSSQANRYTYLNANPLAGTDPSGHCGLFCVIVVGVAIIKAATSGGNGGGTDTVHVVDTPPPPRPTIKNDQVGRHNGSDKTPKTGSSSSGSGKCVNQCNGPGPSVGKTGTCSSNCKGGGQGVGTCTQQCGGSKKGGSTAPNPDPNSKAFQNDRNNATVDKNPPTRQQVNDRKCTTGPCTQCHSA
jgi:RHS repeat-associated protein